MFWCRGMKLSGKVTRVKDYGCFVAFDDSKLSGMCHVSEITTEFVKVAFELPFIIIFVVKNISHLILFWEFNVILTDFCRTSKR